MKWSDFVKQMASVSGSQVDALALAEMLRGGVPTWVGNPQYGCYTEAVIDGEYFRCDYRTQQNYLAIGTDDDWGVYGLTEVSLQAWCDHPHGGGGMWFIPTRKIVKTNWRFSTCKVGVLPIAPHPGEVLASGVRGFALMQDKVNAAMVAAGCSINAFSRARKAYVCGPSMDGDNLYFYGWFFADGSAQQDNPHGGSPHPSKTYSDYSHGCDVVYRNVMVNGVAMSFDELCEHPKLWPLVSDDGPIVPRFPNKGIVIDASAAKTIAGVAVPAGYKGPVYKKTASGYQMGLTESDASAVSEVLDSAGEEDLNPTPTDAPQQLAASAGDAMSGLASALPWIVGLGVVGGLGYYFWKRSR